MPVLWALIDQMGSTWTFQASRMNGDIGFYTIHPDQMQFVNPLLYLFWIPISEFFLYPAFNKLNFLKTTLQKITCGGIIAALGFALSACVFLALEATNPVLPSANNTQIRFYNTFPCDINITLQLESPTSVFLTRGDYYKNTNIELSGNKTFLYSLQSESVNLSGSLDVYEKRAISYYFDGLGIKSFEENILKHSRELPQIR